MYFIAFQALLQIQAIQPISPDETPPDDDEITNNPEVLILILYYNTC